MLTRKGRSYLHNSFLYKPLCITYSCRFSPLSNICVYVAVKQWHWSNTLKIIYSNPAGIAVYLLTPGNYFDGNPFGLCSPGGWGCAVCSQRGGRSLTSAPLGVGTEWPLGHGDSLGIFGLGLAGITVLGARWVLGQFPWGDEWGDGPWITHLGAELKAFPMDFSFPSGPDHHSPMLSLAEPQQSQIQVLHLTSAPRSCSDLPLPDSSVLWQLPWSFPQGAAPQTTPFPCIFTLCTHWWCWLKVVVMETPFSLPANSAGFLSTGSICERASFSCSPFKITAIGNIWGM